jgi:hypothetical protein
MGHQLFDELIGTPPSSAVDVRGIVRRERRSRAFRRLGGSLAAVLALAAFGGVAVASQGTGGDPAVPQAVAPADGGDTRFRLVFDTKESAKATAERLRHELEQGLRKEAPGARWISQSSRPGEARQPARRRPEIAYREQSGEILALQSTSGLVNDGRKGSLALTIVQFSAQAPYPWSCKARRTQERDSEQTCVEAVTPTGMKVQISTYAGRRQPVVTYTVAVELPDNRVLDLLVSNVLDPSRESPAQRESPLSVAQARAIAQHVAAQIKI